jgi:hypothetical protein
MTGDAAEHSATVQGETNLPGYPPLHDIPSWFLFCMLLIGGVVVLILIMLVHLLRKQNADIKMLEKLVSAGSRPDDRHLVKQPANTSVSES